MASYTITDPCIANQAEPDITTTIMHLKSKGGIKFEEPIQGDEPKEYTKISLDEDESKKRVPRQILHFSDGTLEEYSTDEEEEEEEEKLLPVDPKTLTWLPWLWFYFVATAFGMLAVADYFGEKLAWFFGITTPKYQYAIDEYNRMQVEEKEDQEREKREEAASRARYLATTSPNMAPGAMSIEMTEVTGKGYTSLQSVPDAEPLSSAENYISANPTNSLQKY